MNIFLLDKNPKKCAKYHCDQHVVKMILESAQILCTVLHQTGRLAPYKAAFAKHPCTLWATRSLSNWRFLRNLAAALNEEYQFRYKPKDHKSFTVIRDLPEPAIPDLGLTDFALAMPDKYKTNDAVESYRLFYVGEKLRFATWKKREVPKWVKVYKVKLRSLLE